MAEMTLAVLGLIGPVYEAINDIWKGCKDMANFGRDVLLRWRQLNGQWVRLTVVMKRNVLDLKHPPDPNDEHHDITMAVLEQLRVLEVLFGACRDIVTRVLGMKHTLASRLWS